MTRTPFNESQRTLDPTLNCAECKNTTRHLFYEKNRCTEYVVTEKCPNTPQKETFDALMYKCMGCGSLRVWGRDNGYQSKA